MSLITKIAKVLCPNSFSFSAVNDFLAYAKFDIEYHGLKEKYVPGCSPSAPVEMIQMSYDNMCHLVRTFQKCLPQWKAQHSNRLLKRFTVWDTRKGASERMSGGYLSRPNRNTFAIADGPHLLIVLLYRRAVSLGARQSLSISRLQLTIAAYLRRPVRVW